MLDHGLEWYAPVTEHRRGLLVGGRLLHDDDPVAIARPKGIPEDGAPSSPAPSGAALAAAALRAAARDYAAAVRGQYAPPLAALVAFATGDPAPLRPCFPLARALDAAGRAGFDALVAEVARAPGLDLRLFDEGWLGPREVPAPADAALLVAGHLAELFYARRDLLGALLDARPRVWLYTTPRAFAAGGGVAGGCYSPGEGAIRLHLPRLYEGLDGPVPGVAPLLHELGHMLDCLDVGRRRLGPPTGLYPGLRPADGPAYTPEAARLFAAGKAVEVARYRRRAAGEGGEAPFGHPYVFQSDGEFLAGYLELFMRCPNAFAAQNPALYAGYVALFGQDPRRAWPEDFPFYVEANRAFYAGPGRPRPTA